MLGDQHSMVALLLFSSFFINKAAGIVVLGGSGGPISKVGDEIGTGIEIAPGAANTVDLPANPTAIFAITIVIGVITLFQLLYAINRFRKPFLHPNPPTLPYDIGAFFPALLTSYLSVYLLWTILFAVFVKEDRRKITPLAIGTLISDQVSNVFFFAMIFSIITHRLKIQPNPAKKLLKIKLFSEGLFLSTILVLGVTTDALLGAALADNQSVRHGGAASVHTAYEILNLVGSIYFIWTTSVVWGDMKKSGINDNIVKNAYYFVVPVVGIRAVYRATLLGISGGVLVIVSVIISGLTSIAVATFCLFMGAPLMFSKSGESETTTTKV